MVGPLYTTNTYAPECIRVYAPMHQSVKFGSIQLLHQSAYAHKCTSVYAHVFVCLHDYASRYMGAHTTRLNTYNNKRIDTHTHRHTGT